MECGADVDPQSDFCYVCGSRRVLEVNPANNRVVMEKGHCPYCGHDNIPDASFCTSCGRRIGEFEYVARRNTKPTAVDYIAVLLSLIPGAFNIFGLGHLVLKKFSRGFMYLAMTAVVLYLKYATANAATSMLIIIEVIGLVIYLKQAMEIFSHVFGH